MKHFKKLDSENEVRIQTELKYETGNTTDMYKILVSAIVSGDSFACCFSKSHTHD